jgi:class 3 adenylate cyclase
MVVEAERRQVTVLFTDMVGFTSFSEAAGEEAAFRLMRDVARLTGEVVREQGGTVRNFMGDGLMAVFGAPVAYEDAPVRACRAALGIIDRLGRAAVEFEREFGTRPQWRVGINSGLAVVGEVHDGGVTVMGDAVNIAARLQSIAEPGTAYLTEATRRLAEGRIEAEPKGERQVKGRAAPMQVFKLAGLLPDVSRFAAAVQRGLSPFVGRELELDILERNLEAASRGLRVVDIVAEPGMGKSRLLHEFRFRLSAVGVFVLSGNCSPDGTQTPLRPFIEVVRNAFSLSIGEPEADIARKLEAGLTALGTMSQLNLGLMLNLLGLAPPAGALAGLDGLLIGERTRDLLLRFLEARSRASPIALVIEDLHWIDTASEDLLERVVGAGADFRALVLLSQRPEHQPKWLGQPDVSQLALEPLPAAHVRRLVSARLGLPELPDALARTLIERAEGNALFAEELVSYLSERGVLTIGNGRVQYDPTAVAGALPLSLQSLLAARVGRLSPEHRTVLQAASVIGRRFDPNLLAAVVNSAGEVEAALADMEELDLAHPVASTSEFEFKHALVLDAVYQSLLTEPRRVLHFRIAEEVERRSGNRLLEVAETLAHHYGQAARPDKAFVYMAMASAKSLRIYSFEEAGYWFDAAFSLVEAQADCATDGQVAAALADYVLYLNASFQPKIVTATVERCRDRIDRGGDSQASIVIQHHYTLALLFLGRYSESHAAQKYLSAMAARIGDAPAAAYALTSSIWLSSMFVPEAVETFEATAAQGIAAAARVDDPYLQYALRFFIGLDQAHRGHAAKAANIADDLLAVGRRINDTRSIAWGMALKAIIALFGSDFERGLEYAENGILMARTRSDVLMNRLFKISALSALGRPESYKLARQFRDECEVNGWRQFHDLSEGPWGTALIIHGGFGAGLRWLQRSISRFQDLGMIGNANLLRLSLAEVYIRIILRTERAPFWVVIRNLPALLWASLVVESRVKALVKDVRALPHVDREGVVSGRCEMLLGLLCKAKKRRAEAISHLTEAKRLLAQLGPTPALDRVEQALRELAPFLE